MYCIFMQCPSEDQDANGKQQGVQRGPHLSNIPDNVLFMILEYIVSAHCTNIGLLRATFPSSQRVNRLLNSLTLPDIHISSDITTRLEGQAHIRTGVFLRVRTRRILLIAGRSSGLALAIRGMIATVPQWYYSTLVLVADNRPGWFQLHNYIPRNGW